MPTKTLRAVTKGAKVGRKAASIGVGDDVYNCHVEASIGD